MKKWVHTTEHPNFRDDPKKRDELDAGYEKFKISRLPSRQNVFCKDENSANRNRKITGI